MTLIGVYGTLFRGTYSECLNQMLQIEAEGTGWPLEIINSKGEVVKTSLGY